MAHLIEFIVAEGDPGDMVYMDGVTLFQIQKKVVA
jgi:hypothetical protein